MRLIDADKLKCIYPQNKAMHEALNHARTINAIVIPKNATNGDMIKAMFPNMNIQELNHISLEIKEQTVEFIGMALKEWWNSPYKTESEE